MKASPPFAKLIADKGYENQALREWLHARETHAGVPPSRDRKVQSEYDPTIYKQRNVMERMFCLKDWLATHLLRKVPNFVSAVAVAAIAL